MQWKDWMESCLTRPWVYVLTLAKVFAAVMFILVVILVENSLTKPWVENMVFAAVLTNFCTCTAGKA